MGRVREDMSRMREKSHRHLRVMAAVGVVALVAVACKPTPTGTQTGPTTFNSTDSPAYTTGTINGQNGWSSLGAAGSGCAVYDHAVDDVAASGTTPGSFGFGDQALRISDAVTSGCLSDFTFSAPTVDQSGETAANAPDDGQHSGGARHGFWESSWSFATAGNPLAVQTGLHVVASPDRGDGARMSWVSVDDCAATNRTGANDVAQGQCQHNTAGLEVNFSEYDHTVGDFVYHTVVSGLNRNLPHDIRLRMWFFQGPNNDVVEVCVDGTNCVTGHSWEDYFRDVEGNPSRPVDSLLFQTRADPQPANAGNGLFIDNVNLKSYTYTGAAFNVAGGGQVIEGNAGPGDATSTYSVTLDQPVPFETKVHYATQDGTATVANGDYQAMSGDLTFPPNSVGPQTVNVPINGDTVDESHETFSLILSNSRAVGLDTGAESFPRYVAVDTSQKQTTILDDDSTVRINDKSQPEGNAGQAPMPFAVTLDNPSAVTVTVHVQSANGSAVAPGDYTGTNTTLTFTPGQVSKIVNPQIKGDTMVESDENFVMNLSAATNAVIGDGIGVGIIQNDD
jgi:hypothetical protein